MINNYVQYEYEPCHLICKFQDSHDSNLYLGDVSSALDLDFIRRSNIKTVVTAAASMQQVSYKPQNIINHVIYSVLDHKNENLSKFFDQFYDLVQRQIKVGSILVHCAAGISRSSTLVISYIMKKYNWTFKQAIKFVRKSRPIVLPNLGFERQLKQYEKILLKQQQRRLKSKTSESNKHSQNSAQLLPEIGILGQTCTRKKILEAFRIYKNDDQQQKVNRRNVMFQELKGENKFNILKYQQLQKYKPISRQFGQTKSASLQNAVQRNVRLPAQMRISPYIQVKTDQNQVSSSSRHLVSRNGLFDSAMIPIKYNTSNRPVQKLKKTNIQFMNLNTNNITINRINIFKQKYTNNNSNYNGSPLQKNLQILSRNDADGNVLQLRTKHNFSKKLSKVKQVNSQINNLPIFVGKKQMASVKKQTQAMKIPDLGLKNDEHKKITIKNFLFHQF